MMWPSQSLETAVAAHPAPSRASEPSAREFGAAGPHPARLAHASLHLALAAQILEGERGPVGSAQKALRVAARHLARLEISDGSAGSNIEAQSPPREPRASMALDARSRDRSETRLEKADVGDLLERLTLRESQVLRGIIAGKRNKAIAANLGLSPRTVEIYRANVMSKAGCASLSELVVRVTTFEIAQRGASGLDRA